MKTATCNTTQDQMNIKFSSRDTEEFAQTLEVVKSLSGRSFHKETKSWNAPVTKNNVKILDENGFSIQGSIVDKVSHTEELVLPEISETALPGLRAYQREAVSFLNVMNGNGIIADPMGCISGDAIVTIKRGGVGDAADLELRNLYQKFNNIYKWKKGKFWDRSIEVGIRCYKTDQKMIGMTPILRVITKGYKEVLRVTTDSGHTVKATYDHEFYTEDGWKELRLIKKGDKILVHSKESITYVSRTAVFSPVKSKVDAGYTDVYDVSVGSDYHNFIADGIVVHNCGKTIEALGYINYNIRDTFPLLIICPSTIKYKWKREFEKWLGTAHTVSVLDGRTPSGTFHPYSVYIINYDILTYWEEYLQQANIECVIADEGHRLSNPKALRVKAFKKLSKKIDKKIFLSGTPIRSRPQQFFFMLNQVAPNIFPDRWSFLFSYCKPRRNGFGWVFDGLSNWEDLHELVSRVMIRRTEGEIADQLPKKIREVIPVKIDDYDATDIDVGNKSKLVVQKQFDDLKYSIFSQKKPFITKWIDDYLEITGKKLVVFAWHRAVVEDLHSHYKDVALKLYGGVSAKQKDALQKQFMTDPKIRIIVCNTLSGGEGIDLDVADTTLTVELGWTPTEHLQCEDRVKRFTQAAKIVYAYYIIGADTIEEDVMELLDDKMSQISKIVDGEEESMFGKELGDFNKSVLDILVERYGSK